jgi:hypothetical protein
MWDCLTKNETKNSKKLNPRVPLLALGEETLPRVSDLGHSGKSGSGTRGRGPVTTRPGKYRTIA